MLIWGLLFTRYSYWTSYHLPHDFLSSFSLFTVSSGLLIMKRNIHRSAIKTILPLIVLVPLVPPKTALTHRGLDFMSIWHRDINDESFMSCKLRGRAPTDQNPLSSTCHRFLIDLRSGGFEGQLINILNSLFPNIPKQFLFLYNNISKQCGRSNVALPCWNRPLPLGNSCHVTVYLFSSIA